MVGFVIVSHSARLAEGVADLAHMMASDVPVIPAGGLKDGSFGTDYDRIIEAAVQADTGDGVILLMDMGSTVMTAEMAAEALSGSHTVRLADCPVAEGAVVGAVSSSAGASADDILAELDTVGSQKKLS